MHLGEETVWAGEAAVAEDTEKFLLPVAVDGVAFLFLPPEAPPAELGVLPPLCCRRVGGFPTSG